MTTITHIDTGETIPVEYDEVNDDRLVDSSGVYYDIIHNWASMIAVRLEDGLQTADEYSIDQ